MTVALSQFFFSSKPSVVYLECVELYHPNFAVSGQTFRLVRNSASDLSLTHEGPAGPFTYTFAPMTIKPLSASSDLDQDIEITLGDVGDFIATELQNVMNSNGMLTRPTAKYRVYRSDDFSAPLFGPINLRIDGLSMNREGASFKAKSASYNIVRTGEIYRTDRFPMLASV